MRGISPEMAANSVDWIVTGDYNRNIVTCQNRPRRRRRRGGFTLLEVLVCLLLLMVAGAGGLAMVVTTIQSTSFANAAQTASRLGQQLLDQAMVEPFDSLGVGTSTCRTTLPPVYATGSPTGGGTPGNSLTYNRVCTVTPLTNGMKVLRVDTSWMDGAGRTRTITVASQRAP